MHEADRLRPLLLGRRLITGGEISRTHAGERRFEWMVRRPPHFRRKVVAVLAERLDRDREKDRLSDRGDLRPEALLQRLFPERREVGWQYDAGDDLGVGTLERADLRREIVGEILVATGVGELVAGFLQHRRESDLLVAPGIAVAVVWKQTANRFVGRHLAPHVRKDRDNVFEPPEEVIGVIEILPCRRPASRIGLAADEPRLPRRYRRDAGHLLALALR